MGPCSSKSEEDIKSKQIDAMMRREKEADDEITKLLLLGAGESGKSTLFKQMKINFTKEKGYTKSEKAGYISVVHNNIVFNMQQLVKGARNVSPCSDAELEKQILELDPKSSVIDAGVADLLKTAWNDSGIADSWNHRSGIQVQDALAYYMAKIDEIASSEYEPDNQDILRTRVRTSGIVEENFVINGTKVSMYDVGGQRSERRKWMHKFEDVTAVIYVVAISEYDQLVFEDNTTNRQQESLQLFEKVYNSEFFRELSFILFLNKEDLFKEKLPVFPFRVAEGPNQRNVDFKGPYCVEGQPSGTPGTPEFEECVEAAEAYIKGLYLNLNNRKAQLYVHITNATNTENINKIMTSVRDMVLRQNLQKTGFYVGGGSESPI